MTFTRKETGRWKGHAVVRLTGRKPPPVPDNQPGECRLYLDAQTLWPCRIEWLGRVPDRGDVLLVQMEFRDPVLGQPVHDEAFHFDPGSAVVIDGTDRWLAIVRDPSALLPVREAGCPWALGN